LHLLDNPVWQALNSADSRFNQGDAVAGYFPEEVSPFAALPQWTAAMQQTLYDTLPPNRSWSVMIKEPVALIPAWELKFSTTLHQMTCTNFIPYHNGAIETQPLNSTHVPAMLALTALTKPGPFLAHTIDFGNYHGIFDGEELVAMTGERLHLNGYTEISAVCTHPDYEGRGYGALLVSLVAQQVITQGYTPFLHVKWDNQRAIKMYERLGFTHRSDMYFGVFKRR
jgi:predicted GNAT family acetyltransferase